MNRSSGSLVETGKDLGMVDAYKTEARSKADTCPVTTGIKGGRGGTGSTGTLGENPPVTLLAQVGGVWVWAWVQAG